MSKKRKYTDAQLFDLAAFKEAGLAWDDIVIKFNRKHKTDFTYDSIRNAYRIHSKRLDVTDSEVAVATLKEASRARRLSAKNSKKSRTVLDYLNAREDLLEDIQGVVSNLNKSKIKVVKPKIDKKKKKMTMELLLSDIHYGKITDTFNLDVCRNRMQFLRDAFLGEYHRRAKQYNVEKVIVALMGDIIESSTMHGLESARSCEFGNSRQVQEAIISIYEDILVPIASLGVKVHIPAVTGNHDRTDPKKTYNNPGEENLTYIIYKTLEMLCKQAGFKHVTFDIPKGSYAILDIYGNIALYEHYDNSKANSRVALESLMMKRQKQSKAVISFMRGGHFHESTMYGRGTIIVNGSVPGQDSYAKVLGFDSEATQTINFYIETTSRPTSFFASFPVYLP